MTRAERKMNEDRFQLAFIEMIQKNKMMLDSINKANEAGFAVSFTIINGMVDVTFTDNQNGEAHTKLREFRKNK